MYGIGELVVCGSKGVCSVEEITTLNISGVDKERQYYILKPRYMAASTVYVPVDQEEKSLRKVLTREEAVSLIEKIPRLSVIVQPQEKLMEQEYKSCLKTEKSEEWIRVIKTIRKRIQKRREEGRKVTAVDTRYLKMAGECLYGELSVSMELPREEVEDMVEQALFRCMETSSLV